MSELLFSHDRRRVLDMQHLTKWAPAHPDGCTCNPCADRTQRKRYLTDKQYRIEYERGLRRTTDTDRVRAHLDGLLGRGVGHQTVAAKTGVSRSTLWRISIGQISRVRLDTERRLLDFNPVTIDTLGNPIANQRTVDASASRLRYEALIALGYPQRFIALRVGRSSGTLELGDRINRRRAAAILELCRAIGDQAGPSPKAAVQARNRGWRVPASYDDDDFYDPDWDGSEPSRRAVSRAIEYMAEYDFLASCSVGFEQIAQRLGISPAYLRMLIRRRQEP